MTPDEIKKLGEKIASGKANSDEKLEFLRELNKAVEGIRRDFKEAVSNNATK